LGDRGVRLRDGDAALLEGRFSDKLGCDTLERLGVAGRAGIPSSLLGGRLKSPVDGWVVGLDASDNEREERVVGWSCGSGDCRGFDNCWLSLLSNI
jgi:hypothetical protein